MVADNVVNNQVITGNALGTAGCLTGTHVVSSGIAAPSVMPSTAGPVWRSLQVAFSPDATNLLLNFTSYNRFNLSGAPRSSWSRVNFFIDVDNNPTTGFQVNSVCGSELLVQGTGIFRQAAGTFNAGATGTAAIASATLNTFACTISVPISVLRASFAAVSTVRVVALNDETGQYMPPPTMFITARL